MTENKRFLVQIEKNNRSACILDTETLEIYMLVKFGRTDTKTKKKAFIDELYRLESLLNDLNSKGCEIMTEKKRFEYKNHKVFDNLTGETHSSNMVSVNVLNALHEENEQLKNKIDVLEDDNETYHKSLEKLNLYTKRFIPTKCTNEFKDCKTNRYYWLDHEGNFTGCLELLNLLDCEREGLESENRQLKGRLMEYEEQLKGDVE